MNEDFGTIVDRDVITIDELNSFSSLDKYSGGIFYQTLAKNVKDLKQTQIVRKATEIEFKARQLCVENANILQNLYWKQESLIESLIPSQTTSIKIAEGINPEQLVSDDYNLNLEIREASIRYRAACATYKRLTGLDFKQ